MESQKEKFEKLYQEVYKDLYRFALCIVRDASEAEDAVSEGVLIAYEKFHQLRDIGSFRSWIFTIVSNECKRSLKRRKKVVSNAMNLVQEQEGKEVNYDLPIDVRNALMTLPQDERAIIGFSVFGGYNSVQIGEMMGLNASTVRSKRSRGLQKLGPLLQ
ncbi:RNA polymerase sigma factor (sigma-70 family) [Aequitasia blattaphilus]|uniref:Sigma-70 family RNA polymerase sigma factor n=1 Tax=Aequitasia blattaphilus TaxID=2949332 RepID=A0ABT1EA35_9FIRM|nr:sigma-70 family RNA polymerase sigma factor [Aequitasia blattaphilus]MCP1102474.1 sigma-70 family RNA polymerase sigma factor [Aequitasia blattaphilus]MCR8615114.1 sigma-70 family RNA polymerase sigma factor [Aequitasia blattaphilus]